MHSDAVRRRAAVDSLGTGECLAMKSTIAAIDFGTSKIVTLIAETSGAQRCDIIGAGIAMYEGFLDGEWNNPQSLNEAIGKSIAEAEQQAKRKIREINVGVPGDRQCEISLVCLLLPDRGSCVNRRIRRRRNGPL